MDLTTESFIELIKYLKTKGIHGAVAARAIGVNPKTIKSWEVRKRGPKKEHINALLLAFPTQLTAKAQELGIEIPVAKMKIGEAERIEQVLKAMQKDKAKLEKDLELMQEQMEDYEKTKKERDVLFQHVATLTKRLNELENK